ncbi:ribosome small subunit-dependent GTPase, partial [Mammaliicoccus sciuri]
QYNNYLKLKKEIAYNNSKASKKATAEKKKQWKSLTKMNRKKPKY